MGRGALWRTGLRIMREGELSLSISGCSTQKRRPYTLTRQHNADPGGRGEGQPGVMHSLSVAVNRTGPGVMRAGEPVLHLIGGRVGPALHLAYTMELALMGKAQVIQP